MKKPSDKRKPLPGLRYWIGTFFRRWIRYSSFAQSMQSALVWHPQEAMLHDIMEYLSTTSLEGDYLEFGVYQGWSFIAAYKFAQRFDLDQMRFFGFDSFEGLPALDQADQTPYPQYSPGDYACSQSDFERNLKRHGISTDRVQAVPGWYGDTLNQTTKEKLTLDKAAVAWVDCDLYTSTELVLEFLTDLIQPGTILVFDDWFAFRGDPRRGEQGAFYSWIDKNPHFQPLEFRKMGWHGIAFILQKA